MCVSLDNGVVFGSLQNDSLTMKSFGNNPKRSVGRRLFVALQIVPGKVFKVSDRNTVQIKLQRVALNIQRRLTSHLEQHFCPKRLAEQLYAC